MQLNNHKSITRTQTDPGIEIQIRKAMHLLQFLTSLIWLSIPELSISIYSGSTTMFRFNDSTNGASL